MHAKLPNIKQISKYSNYTLEGACANVDARTASDLDLYGVFHSYCAAETSFGQSIFYHYLVNPAQHQTEFNERVRRFDSYHPTEETFRILRKIGYQKAGNLADELWHPTKYNLKKYRLYTRIWMAITLLAFATIPLFGLQMILLNLPIWIINIVIHAKVKRIIELHIGSIGYLMKTISLLPKLTTSLNAKDMPEVTELVSHEKSVRAIRSLQRHLLTSSGTVAGDILSMFRDYIKIFLLVETYAFVSFYGKLVQYQKELQRIYEIVGEIDCTVVVKDICDEYTTCRPQLGSDRAISGIGVVHPLLEECVPNSFHFSKGVILTGTNMSGKSTFLRTVAINQILAQSFGFAFAESWITSFLNVYTSIESTDNLGANESRYMTEAKRLRDAIKLIRSDRGRYLLPIDEILSGTNSDERIRAAIAILRSLEGSGSMVITATHDHEIARALSDIYDNFHFTEVIEKNNMIFDFELKPGIVDGRNAVRLLRHIGYPDDIMDEIERE